MLNKSAKRSMVFALAGIMLLTFCAAPPADAAVIFLVPAVVIGVVAAVGGIGIAIKNTLKPAGEKKATGQEKDADHNATNELKPSMAEFAKEQG